MQLGRFWGFTGPMFTIAFEDREQAIPLFDTMRITSNQDILQTLRDELIYLTRVKNLLVYEQRTRVSEEYNEWNCGALDGGTGWEPVLEREVIERVLVNLLRLQAMGKPCWCPDLVPKVLQLLRSKTFTMNRLPRVVKEIVRSLDLVNGDPSVYLEEYPLDVTVSDSVIIDGEKRIITEQEKAVVQYYASRIPDIEYWIRNLRYTAPQDEVVFGLPFSSIIRRKPESLRYIVADVIEPVKTTVNADILLRVINSIRRDTEEIVRCFSFYVGDVFSEEIPIVTAPPDEVAHLFKWSNLSEESRELIVTMLDKVSAVTPERLASVFGFQQKDWNAFGRKMIDLGICGINGCTKMLFFEAAENAVMSISKIIMPEEEQQRIQEILYDEIIPMTDTFMSVGETIE